jgi:hypothetical protein
LWRGGQFSKKNSKHALQNWAVAERPHEQRKDRPLILVLPRKNGVH